MEPPKRGEDDNWLGEFVAGAVGESRSEEPESAAHILPPAWMELVDGPSPESRRSARSGPTGSSGGSGGAGWEWSSRRSTPRCSGPSPSSS